MNVPHAKSQLIQNLKVLAALNRRTAVLYDHLNAQNTGPATFAKFVDNQVRLHTLFKNDINSILYDLGIDHDGKHGRCIDQYGEKIRYAVPKPFLAMDTEREYFPPHQLCKEIKRYDKELIHSYKKTLQIRPLCLSIETVLLRHITALNAVLDWIADNKANFGNGMTQTQPSRPSRGENGRCCREPNKKNKDFNASTVLFRHNLL